jgi:Flp pilus assembly protein TadG
MKTNKQKSSARRRGSTLILLLILIPTLFMLAALAVNISHVQKVNTDVQVTTDAAVRAASRTYLLTGDKAQTLAAAQEAAARNPIAGVILPIEASDLEYGTSVRTSLSDPYTFTPGQSGNAVRLTTQSFANGAGTPISALFPLFGSVIQIRPLRTATATQVTVDISLVVDRSGSMAYTSSEISGSGSVPPANAPVGWTFGDPVPPQARWLDLIVSVNAFINEMNASPDQERISLSSYALSGSIDASLTTNYSLLTDSLATRSLAFHGGGTNIGDGMLEGLSTLTDPALARPYASKVMIVMTDGNHNYGTWPVGVAGTVANEGITIYTITFSDEANQSLMDLVAASGGGEHFHAVDAAQLTLVFRQIAGRLPTLLSK